MEHAFYLIHSTESGVFQFLVALMGQYVIDHTGNHGVRFLVLMTFRVEILQ